MAPVISVEGVSKRYRIGAIGRGTLQGDVARLWAWMRGRPDPLARIGEDARVGQGADHIWALRDIAFDVSQGEVLGIIGSNGAGKSTLLKILSRVTAPTAGLVRLRGRVASLLEVGTGFHPELTGRENVYLNGAILGMTRAEIRRKFDEIVDFSGVETFIDTPVKRYSSGMYVRLAFAVAAHLEPEILVVDEVLAVGDAAFQAKCLGKMGDVARAGRTVLFVSHNMAAVQRLCRRVVWLGRGLILGEGRPAEVVTSYLGAEFKETLEREWSDPSTAPGSRDVRLRRLCVRSGDGDRLTIRTPVTLEFEYWNLKPGARLDPNIHVFNEQSVLVFNSAPLTEREWHGRAFPAGLFRSSCRIPGDLLNDGLHRVDLLLVEDEGTVMLRLEGALVFRLMDSPDRRGAWHGRWDGAVRPDLEWTTALLKET